MSNKPLCPYCGEHNGHPDGVEMKLYIHDAKHIAPQLPVVYLHICPVCGSSSPMKETKSQAIRSANRRFRPMQKPLALGEARALEENPKWVEIRNESENCRSGWSLASCEYDYKFYYEGFRTMGYLAIDKYGKTWRCWAAKPTDKECAAAKWEEKACTS